jgi:hypothetical protein
LERSKQKLGETTKQLAALEAKYDDVCVSGWFASLISAAPF